MPFKPCPPGSRFGRAIVIEPTDPYVGPDGKRKARSRCQCDCGNTFIAWDTCLRTGHTQSCGCLQQKRASEAKTTHGRFVGGKSVDRTYQSWANMIQRCTNPNSPAYPLYGGQGITICKRWRNSFTEFLADMGECPPKLEIDRWPNKFGNYEPSNCRWATDKQQTRNLRDNLVLTVRGITACLSELCERFGTNQRRVWARLHLGWPIELAFFAPKYYQLRAHQRTPRTP